MLRNKRDSRIELRMKRKKKAAEHIKQCAFCGTKKNLEEHHMIPLSMGGTNDELNLIFLCKDCHNSLDKKKTITPDDIKRKRKGCVMN